MNTHNMRHNKHRLPIKSAVTGGKKYVNDEGRLTGVAALAVETAVALDAMAKMVAVAEVLVGVAVSA